MKGSVVLCLMFVSVLHGLPAAPSKKDEVELVPRKGSPFGDQPIVDTGALFPEDDEGLFGGFQYFQSLMTRIRQQMDDLLKTLPFHGSSNETDFGGLPIGGGLPIVPRFPSVDLGKGNTTSVTKVIDGHKVVINETEYKKEDDFGGAYLKVRIVDLQPDSSEAVSAEEDSSEPSAAAALDKEVTKDREPIETNSFENEIPKGREVGKSSVPEKLTQAA
ncbi:unnamed protein product [Brassicogethes aeneus]|uniref:Icarapin-like n=1 Tax=Brassicogethes aeneus TaxID=1431903 RepID=A0A9P0BGH8_BRAAE|nr:unnamed protein product [Brassicogethes aeneus]